MKKVIIFTILMSSTFFIACDVESTKDVSSITNFATVEIIGNPIVYSEAGKPFNDPGASASISGAEVAYQTLGTIDINTPGIYELTYQVINDDGFAANAFRQVFIYENNGSVAGVYDGIRVTRGRGGPVLVSSRTDGNFNVSDVLGGWYAFALGYGAAYSFPGVIAVDVPGGTVTGITPGVGGFGPAAVSGGGITADGKIMTWTGTLTNYAFGFDVKLTKVTP